MNAKRQFIDLEPLRVRMTTKDGWDGYGYERVEKHYLVDRIDSYKVTSRWIIIYGQIQYNKIVTDDYGTKDKTKIKNNFKIPRTFSDENVLIEYLNNNIGRNFLLVSSSFGKNRKKVNNYSEHIILFAFFIIKLLFF